MDCGITILFFSVLFYFIGFSRGKKQGKEDLDYSFFKKGYQKGKSSIENEIIELGKENDREIIKRIRNFVKNCKN